MDRARFLVVALMVCAVLAEYKEPPPDTANQVHLSLTKSPTEMMVTWSTPGPVPDTSVVYGLSSDFPQLRHSAQGTQTKFVDNGTLHHTQYIHRVVMDGLIPGEKYVYRVRNGTEYGRLFSFTAMKTSEKWENPRFTVYGDFGVDNPRSLPHLIEETLAGVSDIVVHTGDYAYDDWKDNSTWADLWLNMVEPVAAYMPYMVCPGNHEGLYDFLNYRSRFTMPNFEYENLFFSWDAGNTHWIAFDTELYFVYEAMEGHGGVHRNFGPYPELAQLQLEFIEKDLKEANLPENRAKRPWIITYGHRPMYCSDNDDDDCVQMRNQWKQGLEDLFYKYHVDFVIEAHQHTYERLWPVYNGVVYNGSAEAPYTNPGAPVHIVAGAAGCDENLDTFGPALGDWSALRLAAYGYGHLNIHNATHAHWEQLDVSNYSVVDEIWVVKDKGHTSWGPSDPSYMQESVTIS